MNQELLIKIAEDVAATKTAVEALGGPQGRVTKLEESHERHFWYTVAIVPFLAIGHAVARKFGVQI